MVSFIATAYAQTSQNPAVAGILSKVLDNVVNPIVDLVFALATVIFIWGLYQYFISEADGAKRAEGAQHILWGVVGMFIMVSVWGIIRFVLSTIGVPANF
ncbi:MAG: hypothetical protein HZA80_01780 [Candidatus Taylorbacteria bacterium]|nr:hypothetical protein [Candidatus Taylorbacteria bacterium]